MFESVGGIWTEFIEFVLGSNGLGVVFLWVDAPWWGGFEFATKARCSLFTLRNTLLFWIVLSIRYSI